MNEHPRSPATEERTRGATAVEYALIVALIAAVIIVAVGAIGTKTEGLYNTTNTEMTNNGL
jgi:pilus assembly protein Flp/PilA